MKRKKVIAGILLVGIIGASLAGCKNTNITKKERKILANLTKNKKI